MDPIKENKVYVASFYMFVDWVDFESYKFNLEFLCAKEKTVGTILIASEGINGSISGRKESIDNVLKYIKSIDLFNNLKPKISIAYGKTFKKMKVRIKKEIVTLGVDNLTPGKKTGNFIESKSWNHIVSDPNTILLDTRNYYEHSIGTFEGSLQPEIKSFRDFPKWVSNNLDHHKDKKIAMFCTGGIRCEKASSYLMENGYKDVVQLDGGILKYLEKVQEEDSMWQGECFVFDYRISLKHGLEEGNFDMCHACRMPITDEDKLDKRYIREVSCHNCYGSHSKKSMKRFLEKKKQLDIRDSKESKKPFND
jgi:UPF0176 protein